MSGVGRAQPNLAKLYNIEREASNGPVLRTVTNSVYVFIDASNLWQAQKARGRMFDYEKLKKESPKANCLHAHSGTGMLRKDEIVIYKEEQSTIKYLVEIK